MKSHRKGLNVFIQKQKKAYELEVKGLENVKKFFIGIYAQFEQQSQFQSPKPIIEKVVVENVLVENVIAE